jgi:hypothetical protein
MLYSQIIDDGAVGEEEGRKAFQGGEAEEGYSANDSV